MAQRARLITGVGSGFGREMTGPLLARGAGAAVAGACRPELAYRFELFKSTRLKK